MPRHKLVRCPTCQALVYTSQPRALIRGPGWRMYELRRHDSCSNRTSVSMRAIGRDIAMSELLEHRSA